MTNTKITVCSQLKIFAGSLSEDSEKAMLDSGDSYFVLLGVKISGEEIKFNLPRALQIYAKKHSKTLQVAGTCFVLHWVA